MLLAATGPGPRGVCSWPCPRRKPVRFGVGVTVAGLAVTRGMLTGEIGDAQVCVDDGCLPGGVVMPDTGDVGVGLAEVLEGLRADLAQARELAAGQGVQFPVQSVTVELKVGVTTTVDGKAGFRVPVLGAELGGGAGRTGESVQTITLMLGQPVDQNGNPVKVASTSDELKD